MKVVLIGAGNVATIMGRRILEAGHNVVQVFNRDIKRAQTLAESLDADFCNEWSKLQNDVDMYVVAIADNALYELHRYWKCENNALVVHTAGTVSIEVLKDVSKRCGVLYPLQSLHSSYINQLQEIPLMVNTNNDADTTLLYQFASTISPGNVSVANDEQRRQMHVAAVIVNNFTNHLFSLAYNYCVAHELDFKQLFPLINETVSRLKTGVPPASLQTGPAVRKDTVTINRHMELLANDIHLQEIYKMMTESIMHHTS